MSDMTDLERLAAFESLRKEHDVSIAIEVGSDPSAAVITQFFHDRYFKTCMPLKLIDREIVQTRAWLAALEIARERVLENQRRSEQNTAAIELVAEPHIQEP